MQRTMFKSKIHRATVTEADLDYEGSVTIDADLLDAADLLEHESVSIWNVTNGARVETYTLRGEAGSGVICINGAAAHHFSPGDVVIIASWAIMEDQAARSWKPTVVLVDGANRLKSADHTERPFTKSA